MYSLCAKARMDMHTTFQPIHEYQVCIGFFDLYLQTVCLCN